MSKRIRLSIGGSLFRAVDSLSERFYPGCRYRFSRYIFKALIEKVAHDTSRLRRMRSPVYIVDLLRSEVPSWAQKKEKPDDEAPRK